MADTTKFTVARAHWGDKAEGETVKRHRYEKDELRLADPDDDEVKELVKRGVLAPSSSDAKGAVKTRARRSAKSGSKTEVQTDASVEEKAGDDGSAGATD